MNLPVRLFHFSDDPAIADFKPRPVRTPVERPCGHDWLNGPLVWAIDDAHSFLYFFPRECPRILVWPTMRTTTDDHARWMGSTAAAAVAFIEESWLGRLRRAEIYRYGLPAKSFESVGEIGMWVSHEAVTPVGMDRMTDLPDRLKERRVELRTMESLLPLKGAWLSSLHVSGIRLRNAAGWGAPGRPHTRPPP